MGTQRYLACHDDENKAVIFDSHSGNVLELILAGGENTQLTTEWVDWEKTEIRHSGAQDWFMIKPKNESKGFSAPNPD